MVDISDMLFIVGHVGHIWRSWETKLCETITRSKVFEVQSFREPIFLGRYWDFFLDQNFRDRYRDFFSRLNIFETDTETFFWDQNFRDRDRYSQKIEKSLDTEKSRDEMSHSDCTLSEFFPLRGYPKVCCHIVAIVHFDYIYCFKAFNLNGPFFCWTMNMAIKPPHFDRPRWHNNYERWSCSNSKF